MASLQFKGNSWYCQFMYKGHRHTVTVGEVAEVEAQATAAKVQYLLMRLKQNLMTLPPGCDIVNFVKHDGKPPAYIVDSPLKEITFGELRDRYLVTHGNGTLEESTLDGIKQHFKHWRKTLSDDYPVGAIGLAELQKHVDRRVKMKGILGTVSPATVKKEIITLRTAWNWAARFGHIKGKFPAAGLRYPKSDEKPPFQTRPEIERQLASGGLSARQIRELWDALYLRLSEIDELLAHVQAHATLPWLYPLYCFAAHTGARRSELINARVADVDMAGETAVIREKKRVRGKRSQRRVPLTPKLKAVMQEYLASHPGGEWLFCQRGEITRSKKRSRTTGHKSQKKRAKTFKGRAASVTTRTPPPVGQLTRTEVHHHFKRILKGTKWNVIRGLHCLRHSFISACASRGVDQRLIQEWCGHMTVEMVRRYTHLYPSTQQAALKSVFE